MISGSLCPSRQTGRRPRRAPLLVAGLLVSVGGLSGCANGELPTALPSINLPTVTVTPPTLPGSDETTDAPNTSQETEAAAPTEEAPAETTSDPGMPTWAWVLAAVAILVGLIAWIGRVVGGRREVKALTEDVITRGGWVVDHGTGALLGAQTPDATQLAWSQLDGALVDLTRDLRRLEPVSRGDRASLVMEVRDAVAAVRMSAETDAKARLSGKPQGDASTGSAEALFAARRRLTDALAAFDPDSPAH